MVSNDVPADLPEDVPAGAGFEQTNATNGNAVSALKSEIAQLQEQLAAEAQKANDHWERLLRTQAEFQNAVKRNRQQLEEAHRYGIKSLATELLTVMDGLDNGLKSSDAQVADSPVAQGLRLTHKLLDDLLAKFSIIEIKAQGAPFDPACHEALVTQPTADMPENHVLSVIQKGYMLHDRVLRPARVVVAKALPAAEEEKGTA